jgi:GNAT superfamily N-acetyltransferase
LIRSDRLRSVPFGRFVGAPLDKLFTDRRFQGQGQGQGHGAALLADAEARGARSLEAFAANLRARRFYEARGWRKTREYERDFVGQVRAIVYYEK